MQFFYFNCKYELGAWYTLVVLKTSLCNVICHSVFITMTTGRPSLFPLKGKLKTMIKKKPYLFTFCFHRGGEQERVWVYYLSSCKCKDVKPYYVCVLSGGRVMTQNTVPLAVFFGPKLRGGAPHSQVSVVSKPLGSAAVAGYRSTLISASVLGTGFNPLFSQDLCLVYAISTTAFLCLFLFNIFSFSLALFFSRDVSQQALSRSDLLHGTDTSKLYSPSPNLCCHKPG